ncbi:MAG: transcription termination factor NusA [Kiritimatiellae bacterium]|nr:transcription termination factor NusA [Kiritimatiellia bacterium]MBQ9343671.1 transcription termination factor NusA [Kiritimatiellia bacterium]
MNIELRSMVDYYEQDNRLDREVVIGLLEASIQAVVRKRYPQDALVREPSVKIDRGSFNIRIWIPKQVVDFVSNRDTQMSVEDADRLDPVHAPHAPGSIVDSEIPFRFGRIEAQNARQIIQQKLRDADQNRVKTLYQGREDTLVRGTVRRFERHDADVVVDLDDAEAVMPMKERVPSEKYNIGDRMRFLLLKVDDPNNKGAAQIILSRRSEEFIRKLFEAEVVEIADGSVAIRGIARLSGVRTKIAVAALDDRVDPLGACVGMRGQRIKGIVRELSGERVDVVKWSPDIKTFVTNALSPAKISRIDVDEDTETVHVRVPEDQLSLAIGKGGQNARLTARLTGWKVDIKQDEGELTQEEIIERAAKILVDLGLTRDQAKALMEAGFTTVEGIAEADVADLVEAEGMDAETAAAIHLAARKIYPQPEANA